jgi:prephenate dehydrogenase
MGGAVGLAARRANAALRVTGVTAKRETVEKARQMGAVDEATLDLRAGVQDADLVVLAVPVHLIPAMAQSALSAAQPEAIITDLGSTKAGVVAAVDELISKQKAQVRFVGSHPLAGSERSGIDAAPLVRLAGALCILTPTSSTNGEAYRQVDEFWKSLGMRTMRLPPGEHDAVLARSSHFPHLLAFALLQAQTDRSLSLSGPGLRDMTRLAGSDVSNWVGIFTQNAGELAKVTKEFSQEMRQLSVELEALAAAGTPGVEAARERLFRYLADARQRREEHFRKAPGAATEARADGAEPPTPEAL